MSSALSEKLFDPGAQLDAPQFPNSSVTRDQSNRCETATFQTNTFVKKLTFKNLK